MHTLIENTARAQLNNIQDSASFEEIDNSTFIKSINEKNKEAFAKHSKFLCDTNVEALSFGYLSKWIAECNMDFE